MVLLMIGFTLNILKDYYENLDIISSSNTRNDFLTISIQVLFKQYQYAD